MFSKCSCGHPHCQNCASAAPKPGMRAADGADDPPAKREAPDPFPSASAPMINPREYMLDLELALSHDLLMNNFKASLENPERLDQPVFIQNGHPTVDHFIDNIIIYPYWKYMANQLVDCNTGNLTNAQNPNAIAYWRYYALRPTGRRTGNLFENGTPINDDKTITWQFYLENCPVEYNTGRSFWAQEERNAVTNLLHYAKRPVSLKTGKILPSDTKIDNHDVVSYQTYFLDYIVDRGTGKKWTDQGLTPINYLEYYLNLPISKKTWQFLPIGRCIDNIAACTLGTMLNNQLICPKTGSFGPFISNPVQYREFYRNRPTNQQKGFVLPISTAIDNHKVLTYETFLRNQKFDLKTNRKINPIGQQISGVVSYEKFISDFLESHAKKIALFSK